MTRSLRLIAYDISCDRRRCRLEKLVSRVAVRVQYSVFQGWMTDAEVDRFLKLARGAVAGTDSLLVFRLCGACAPETRHLGRGLPAGAAPPPEVLV